MVIDIFSDSNVVKMSIIICWFLFTALLWEWIAKWLERWQLNWEAHRFDTHVAQLTSLSQTS